MDKDQLKELNAKIQLDNKFQPKVQRLIKRVIKDFEKTYSEKGSIIEMQPYSERWESLLDKHYKSVAGEFSGIASSSLEIKPNKKHLYLILAGLFFMRKWRKSSSAREINQANSDQLSESVEKARGILADSQLEINNGALATVAAQLMRGKVEGRAKTIAMTETQFIAETTKKIEADALTNNKNEYLDAAVSENASELADSPYVTDEPKPYQKEWLSALLPTTRPAHAAAHGQKVAPSELFYVGGEYLKYPGDTSMGATAGNVVNCYCAVRYNK